MNHSGGLQGSYQAVKAVLSLVLVACGDDPTGKELADPVFPPPATQPPPTTIPVVTTAPAPLRLVTPWVDGAALPDRSTCAGAGTDSLAGSPGRRLRRR